MINRIARKIYNEYRLSIIAKRVFDAALTDQQKTLVDEYTNKRQQGLSFGPIFCSDRTYFNLGKSSLDVIETPQQIVDILDKEGYYCPDYREGYVYKKDDKLKSKPVKLIKVLRKGINDNQQFNVLKKMFDQRMSTSRKQMVNCLICITHNPYDVAGMSTDRSWTSCMELPGINNKKGGDFYDTALKQVQYGGMCAYLIESDDKQIQRPLARIAIKRLVGNNGGFIFVAQTSIIYGEGGFANELNFVEEVEKILNESNKQTLGESNIFQRKDEDSYTDSGIYEKYMFKDNNDLIQYFKQNINDFIRNEKFIENLTYEQRQFLFPYLIKYIDINYEGKKIDCLYKLMYRLTSEQRKSVIDLFIEKQDIKYLYKLIYYNRLTKEQRKLVINVLIKKQETKCLYKLIDDNKLTEEQRKSVFNMLIRKQDAYHLYQLIYKDKLTEEQKKSAIDMMIKKQDTGYLFLLIDKNILTEEQRKSAINTIFKKQDTQHLYQLIRYNNKLTEEQKKRVINVMLSKYDTKNLFNLIYEDKLTEEQIKSVVDMLIRKQDIKHLYQLIYKDKLIEEQKKSVIDFIFSKQDTQNLYKLIIDDELTEEQIKSAVDIIIKKQDTYNLCKLIEKNILTEEQKKSVFNMLIRKQDTWNLYLLIKDNRLTEEQLKSAIDIIFKKQDTGYLFLLIKEDKLTEEQRKSAISVLIKKQDTKHLSWLINDNKLTEQQINQFNLSYLK